MPADEPDKMRELFIVSLVSNRDQKPRIEMKLGELRTQMSADAAMDVAKNIIECSMGAYADAFLFNFITQKLGQPKEIAAQLLQEFRIYRDDLALEFKEEQRR